MSILPCLPTPSIFQQNLPLSLLLRRKHLRVKSHVKGFHVSIKYKKGCALRTRPTELSEDIPYTNIGADEHFEVTITCDGTNPHYPKNDKPWKVLLTNALTDEHGSGMVGKILYEPPGVRFTGVEVVEEYEDWRCCERVPRPDPEHLVSLRVYAQEDSSGKHTTSLGLISRPV